MITKTRRRHRRPRALSRRQRSETIFRELRIERGLRVCSQNIAQPTSEEEKEMNPSSATRASVDAVFPGPGSLSPTQFITRSRLKPRGRTSTSAVVQLAGRVVGGRQWYWAPWRGAGELGRRTIKRTMRATKGTEQTMDGAFCTSAFLPKPLRAGQTSASRLCTALTIWGASQRQSGTCASEDRNDFGQVICGI